MPSHEEAEKLNEDYEDALFRMVMHDAAEREGAEFLSENKLLNERQKSSPSSKNIKKFTRLLDSQLRKSRANPESSGEIRAKGERSIPRRRFFRTSLVAAMILLLSLTLAAQATGVNFVQLIGTWTEETFHFTTGVGNAENEEPTAASGSGERTETGYNSLSDALRANGMSSDSVPAWWPAGFTLSAVNVEEMPDTPVICALYENGEKSFVVSVHRRTELTGDSMIYEKDDNPVIQYKRGGITHYIMSNLDTMQAVWTDDAVIYNISGQLTTAEIEKMIDSIYTVR